MALSKQKRLLMILERCCHNKKVNFSDRLGISQQGGVAWFANGTYNSDKLIAAFPELSPEWVTSGTGPMFLSELESDEQMALDILHITSDELEAFRTWQANQTANAPVFFDTPKEKECTHVYAYEGTKPIQIAEGDPVDRALLNFLLREKSALEARLASKDQELEVLRQRNLTLEKENAVMSDRLTNAEHWYRTNFQNKKG